MDRLLDQQEQLIDLLARLLEQQGADRHFGWLSRWQPFKQYGSGTTGSGTTATVVVPCPTGWEWKVGRIVTSATGNNASANIQAQVNSSQAFDTSGATLEDFSYGMFGNSPSWNIADEQSPIFVPGGENLIIYVSNAAASSVVTVRVTGERRQTRSDPE